MTAWLKAQADRAEGREEEEAGGRQGLGLWLSVHGSHLIKRFMLIKQKCIIILRTRLLRLRNTFEYFNNIWHKM